MNSTIPDYEPISLRGSGAFGYVIEAYDRIHDARVAIKRTHKVGTKLSREYEILSELKDCEYVVKLMDTFYSVNDDGKVIQNLVFEYVTRSLEVFMEEYRRKKKYIPLEKIKQISRQLLLGLDFCHKKHIVHRDLKPENVLFTQDDQVKICDFGSSKCISNEKIDIFAAGCIIAELFTLTPLFPGKTEGLQIFEHMCILGNPGREYFSKFTLPPNYVKYFETVKINGINKFDEVLNEEGFYDRNEIKNAANLILNMLNWDEDKRFSAEQCLNHPFFSNKSQKEARKEIPNGKENIMQ